MRNFRELRVWESAHQVVLAVYSATAAFPAYERFGLTSQLRRAAVSVAANIAEGAGYSNDGSARQAFRISLGFHL